MKTSHNYPGLPVETAGHNRLYGVTVSTSPLHGLDTGSIPVRVNPPLGDNQTQDNYMDFS